VRHLEDLTTREREVLDLVGLGLTNEEIAQRLRISLDGAKYHVSQILSKLGVSTREQAAAVALGGGRRWWATWPLWARIAGAAAVAVTVAGIPLLVLGVTFTGTEEQLPAADGDGNERPKESARPELTADQIVAELERLYSSSGQEGPSHRAFVVERSFNSDGTQVESTREEVTVGEDKYTKNDEGYEVLVYKGQAYGRASPSGKWLTLTEAGFGVLENYFDNLVREAESTSDGSLFDPLNPERLPDEFVGKRHAVGVGVRYQLDDEIEFFREGLEGLPTASPTTSVPDRAEMEIRFWLDAGTLEPLRVESDYVGFLMGEQIQRIVEETTYSDFNEIDELPVQLPETAE
jgi:DNA-binding CsgD family transcriptional regulator